MISVIIPIYRVEKYLCQCVESVINQTYKYLEVLLVDDGSPDRCPEICDAFAKKDARVKVIHKENEGLVAARKSGLNVCTGQYIVFVDGDDWIDEDWIEQFYANGCGDGIDMIAASGLVREYGNKGILASHSVPSGIYMGEDIIDKVYPLFVKTNNFYETDLVPNIFLYAFSRDLITQNYNQLDNRIRMGEDFIGVFFCLLEAESISLANFHGYHYRQRLDSMVHSYLRNEKENLAVLYNQLDKRIHNHKIKKELEKKVNFYTIYLILLSSYSVFLEMDINYLYPFKRVNVNSNIVIYGAGTFGKQLVNSLKDSKKYNIVLWIDKEYEFYQSKLMEVSSPESINNCKYDYVVIAVGSVSFASQIYSQLIRLNVPEKKIARMDFDVVSSTKDPLHACYDVE